MWCKCKYLRDSCSPSPLVLTREAVAFLTLAFADFESPGSRNSYQASFQCRSVMYVSTQKERGCGCNHFNNYTTCNHGLMYRVIFLTPLHSIVTRGSHCCLIELSTALLACSVSRSNSIRSDKVSGSSALYTNHTTTSTMVSNTISYDPDPIRWPSWRKCNWCLGSWS